MKKIWMATWVSSFLSFHGVCYQIDSPQCMISLKCLFHSEIKNKIKKKSVLQKHPERMSSAL